ncbi:hypothetical protein J6590_001299 [Homalodisca vitripennis]|nr:hypothetical protein J6590_001299 [Homalodisca vitripennis]
MKVCSGEGSGSEGGCLVASVSLAVYCVLSNRAMEEQMWRQFYDKLQEKETKVEEKTEHEIRSTANTEPIYAQGEAGTLRKIELDVGRGKGKDLTGIFGM